MNRLWNGIHAPETGKALPMKDGEDGRESPYVTVHRYDVVQKQHFQNTQRRKRAVRGGIGTRFDLLMNVNAIFSKERIPIQ